MMTMMRQPLAVVATLLVDASYRADAFLPAPLVTSTGRTSTHFVTSTPSCLFGSKSPLLISAECVDDGKLVEIAFDGDADSDASYRFHAMWLRDACRDEAHVAAGAGERILTSTPVGPPSQMVDPSSLRAAHAKIEGNEVVVTWNDADAPSGVGESRFTADILTRYAPIVAKPSVGARANGADGWTESAEDIPTWLEPYTGYPDARAPREEEIRYFTNEDPASLSFPSKFDHSAVTNDNGALLEMIQSLLCDGAALIDNVPPEGDSNDAARELHAFISHSLGGLQKDPTRSEANWKIVKKEDASSISYDHAKRLYQHTDSSIPPHGIPGLVLSMHYIEGYGANTLTDGFAVARALKEEDPEAFDLLATYGYDGERDFAASRVDSTQDHAKGLVVRRKHPIFVLDPRGELCRVQYNEVFRMPLSLPFDVFPRWYAAFSKFVSMVHDGDRFEVTVPMKENTILLMNNWRVLHGRAGGRASPDRHLVGGTIVREAVYSRAMQLARILRPE